MSKLLAVDLDGTLFYPRGIFRCISKKNVKFLQHWIDSGNKVVLISSRSYNFVSQLHKEIGRNVDFLSGTGAQIFANGKLISDLSMPKDELKEILNHIETSYQPIAIMASGKEGGYFIKQCNYVSAVIKVCYLIWWFFQLKYREPFCIDNNKFNDYIENHEISKVMIFYGLKKNKSKISKEINKSLRNKFNYIECSWSSQVNELTPPNCNKANGLINYCKLMNIDKNDVYVVGDSGNDITMFNDFHEHSYCMKHAYPSVKKYASHIIKRVHNLDKLVLKGEILHETN